MNSQFYISRGKGTQGPFTLGEIQTYLAYGSIAEMDLVMREGSEDWVPVSSIPEIRELTEQTTSRTGKKGNPALRRRTARYREYDRVPLPLRAGTVLRQLVVGFILWPPSLWKAGSTVFTNYTYRRAKDDAGYLRIWPRWVEPVVSVMIVVNIVVWLGLFIWVSQNASPVLREVMAIIQEGVKEVEAWMQTGA